MAVATVPAKSAVAAMATATVAMAKVVAIATAPVPKAVRRIAWKAAQASHAVKDETRVKAVSLAKVVKAARVAEASAAAKADVAKAVRAVGAKADATPSRVPRATRRCLHRLRTQRRPTRPVNSSAANAVAATTTAAVLRPAPKPPRMPHRQLSQTAAPRQRPWQKTKQPLRTARPNQLLQVPRTSLASHARPVNAAAVTVMAAIAATGLHANRKRPTPRSPKPSL